jgi:DNA-binding Lrp family transcriptional regulator
MEIDDIDRDVLAALIADGRASDADLDSAAGVGTSTASWRRQSLEGGGVIDGYRPRLDYAALGYGVTALLRVDVDPSVRDDVVARLAEDDRFHTVYEVAGPADVVAIGRFPDRDSLVRTRRRLRGTDGVGRVRVTPVQPVVELDQFVPETAKGRSDGHNPGDGG